VEAQIWAEAAVPAALYMTGITQQYQGKLFHFQLVEAVLVRQQV
jgi:hypothetical protein